MLKKSSKGMIAIAAAATLLGATPMRAETVTVLIMERTYFPSEIYVSDGDTLIFTNESGSQHTVQGQNGQWTTGAISSNGEYTLQIEAGLHGSFGGLDVQNVPMSANMHFSHIPLGY